MKAPEHENPGAEKETALEDGMREKLAVLKKAAAALNGADVTWCLGASGLLYFKGLVETFHDIDIMVTEEDADKAEAVFLALGARRLPPNPDEKYRTRRFLEYVLEGVEFDVIAGFVIVNGGTEYDCSLTRDRIGETAELEGVTVPLHSLALWKKYYSLMGREKRAALLREY